MWILKIGLGAAVMFLISRVDFSLFEFLMQLLLRIVEKVYR